MLHLTPEMLEAAYEYLRTTPPFNKWRLPDTDSIEFHVIKPRADLLADYQWWAVDGEIAHHRIRVSVKHGKFKELIESMAHEMCHMRQRLMNTTYATHGRVFKRLAAQVCRHHGFDEKMF